MIYEIVRPFKVDPDHVYIKPLHCVDAWEAYLMLDKCFPYNEETHGRHSWEFFICCFGGYENCLMFKQYV